jgi:hypothetical protein
MDAIERLALDLVESYSGREIFIVPDRSGWLTAADFLRLREEVKKLDPFAVLRWLPRRH